MRGMAMVAAALVALGSSALAADRQAVRVVGSSSLYAFAAAVAENLRGTTRFRAPVIESTGTGGGFKAFCAGVGLGTPDIAAASRPITAAESDLCKANGVTGIEAVRLGHDGVVLAHSRGVPAFALTRRQVWLALAKRVPVDGQLAPNPHRRWKDVDPSLPDLPIRVYGPPPTSGTRDVFVQVAMEGGCEAFRPVRDLPADQRREACGHFREDGAFVEVGEDDELAARKVAADREALAVVGFGALRRHANLLVGLPLEGVAPNPDTIAAGTYPLARSVFLYVKKDHLGVVPGLAEYLNLFTSPAAIGPDGYLVPLGLVPLK